VGGWCYNHRRSVNGTKLRGGQKQNELYGEKNGKYNKCVDVFPWCSTHRKKIHTVKRQDCPHKKEGKQQNQKSIDQTKKKKKTGAIEQFHQLCVREKERNIGTE
jgi:hypothetical protein